MEHLFRFFAKRHLFANVFTVMVLLVGITAALTIKRDILPRISIPQVGIRTMYPGASPEDVEINVTGKIEESLQQVDGIKEITSLSAEGISTLVVKLDDSMDDLATERAIQEIRDAIGRIDDFPEDITSRPVIRKMKTAEAPVIEIGLSSEKLSYRELREEARRFEKKLKRVTGVSRYERYGFRKRQVRIEVIPELMNRYQISFDDIIKAIKNRNISESSGAIGTSTISENILTVAQFKNPYEVKNVIVRTTFASPAVRVKDIAIVRDHFEDERIIAKINGKKVISYSVFTRDSADSVRTVERIRELVDRTAAEPGMDVEFLLANDRSEYVRAAYSVVVTNGVTGFILVIILLTLFLRFRISIWVAAGIPLSLLGTLALLPAFGYYMDVISLSAMILVLGIIVDDAIIISESIYRRWEMGDPPVEAAVNGLKQVILPVMTTVFTTFLAFLPMFLIPGSMGKFIFVIPLVITLAISFSILEGVIALPSHIARSLESGMIKSKRNYFAPLEAFHESLLKKILHYRYLLTGLFLLALGGSIIYAGLVMEFEFFPKKSAETFIINLETPVSTSLERTVEMVDRVEEIVSRLPKEELGSYTSVVGKQMMSIEQEHYASIRVNLTPYSTRERDVMAITEYLRKKIQGLKGFSKIVFDIRSGGPSAKKAVSFKIVSSNDRERQELTQRIIANLKKIRGVNDIDRDDLLGRKQFALTLNHNTLARTGLSVAEVSWNLRTAFDGREVTTAQFNGEEVAFQILVPKKYRNRENLMSHISIPNQEGMFIPLKSLASFSQAKGFAAIRHFDGERAITVEASIDKTITDVSKVNKKILGALNMPQDFPESTILIGGDEKDRRESMGNFILTFSLAVLGIYFLLLLLFSSLLQPFVVLSAIPFGIYGVIFAFGIHGIPFSFMGMMGIIGMCGVVVNDSLVLVDSINRKRNEDNRISLYDIVAKGASERLRPVVLTTITTAAGILPLAYGIGGDDPINAPMALALGWGLIMATPLTLVLMPCLYIITEDIYKIKDKLIDMVRLVLRL